MGAEVAELVHEGAAADDGEVVDDYLAGELCGIGYDDVVAHDTVVRDMGVCHDEAVIAHDGLAPGGGAAVDGYALAQHGIVAYDGESLFSDELEILRHGANHHIRENGDIPADA